MDLKTKFVTPGGTIYKVDNPEEVGVMPIRSDLPIDKSDASSEVGWTIEVKEIPIFIIETNQKLSLNNFKSGLKVKVMTLIGMLEMTTVVKCGSKCAETEKYITYLDVFDRIFLTSHVLINKKMLDEQY